MPRIPDWLKRVVLPAWNGAHRWGRRLGEHLDALIHRRFERCTVCGRFGPMLYRRAIVPPELVRRWGLTPALVEAIARRESNDCGWCGAKLRARRIAEVLLAAYPGTGAAGSVAEWVRRGDARSLRIAEINRIEGLHDVLVALPGLAYSEFHPGAESGGLVDGIRSEDLRHLSYADGSFDLVLTSETLEHVPDLDAALGEIRRVLVPGGLHLFTVPMLPGVPATFSRAQLSADGGMTITHPPLICHPGGDVGYPVFTEFGADWPARLRDAGFSVTVHFGPVGDRDLGQVYETRKTDLTMADGRPSGYAPLEGAE